MNLQMGKPIKRSPWRKPINYQCKLQCINFTVKLISYVALNSLTVIAFWCLSVF